MMHRPRSKLFTADTGNFLLLEGFQNHASGHNLSKAASSSHLPCQSLPACAIRESRYTRPSKDPSQTLDRKYISISLTRHKFQSLAKDSSPPAYQTLEILPNLKAWPCSLPIDWPGVLLLLGKDCSKPLKMLLQPTNGESLAMKTLMVLWNG